MSLDKLVYRLFTRKHGLTLHADAHRLLESSMAVFGLSEHSAPAEITSWLESAAAAWESHNRGAAIVDSERLGEVLRAMARERGIGGIGGMATATSATSAATGTAQRQQTQHQQQQHQQQHYQHFHVIDAFDTPRLGYSSTTEKFAATVPPSSGGSALLASPETKAAMFSERLDFIRQSIQRSDHFTESGVLSFGGGQHASGSRMRLSAIKSLLGRDGDSVLILGLLARKEDGRLCLEDESGRIPLVFPEVLPKGRVLGLFTENCVVLAEGTYEDGELTVAAIGHPPLEPRQDVRMLLNGINYFGGPQTLGTSSSLAAGRRLGGDIRLDLDSIGGSSGGSSGGDGSDDGDHTIVVLSDIHLDDPDTLAALRTLFAGFSVTPPTAFVLCGNFLSMHGVPGSGFSAAYQAAFAALASLIAEHRPLMQRSHFVVVPGPSDPWTQGSSTILPRRPLPASLTSAFREKVPHAVFASNPCRILIRSSSRSRSSSSSRSAAQSDHEMVVFRADLVSTIQRNCVIRPPHITANKFPVHVAQLVVRQSHLYPLPLRVCPVLWGYEHALRLYPAPDAVILADRFEHYSQAVEIGSGSGGNGGSGGGGGDAVNVINPGSFSSSTSGRRFGFFVYQTGTRAAQVSYVSSTR